VTNSQYSLINVLMGYRLGDSSFIHCRCSFEARLHKTWKALIRFVIPVCPRLYVRPPVRPFARISASPTKRVSVKFRNKYFQS